MRGLTSTLLIVLAITTSAQSWCPPGAEWNWQLYGFGMDGHAHRWYDGDTIIDGRTAQRIREESVRINYFSQDTTAFNATTFTSVENDDVLLWAQYDGVWQWDTLYRFGAVPGTTWQPASPYGGSSCVVQVTDTSTIVIDGIPLRRLMLDLLDENGDPLFETTITERLGGEWGMWELGMQCILDAEFELIRCYSDVDLQYIAPNWNYGCNSVLNVLEEMPASFGIHPNPGTDHFTLQLPPGPHQLTLFDAQGRQVQRQLLSEERPVISTALLPSGIYHMHITDRYGRISGQRWVKE